VCSCADAANSAVLWQGVSEAESRRAADSALEAYVAAFCGDVAPEEAALDAEHRAALQAGDRAFRAIAVGDEAVQQASLRRYHDQASTVLLPGCGFGRASEAEHFGLLTMRVCLNKACDAAARPTRGTSLCGRASWRRRRWRARSCSTPRPQRLIR